MNESTKVVLPRFAAVDRRRDGGLRILAEFVDEATARRYVEGLRWAGSPAYIVLLTRVEGAADVRLDDAGQSTLT